jgi:hypothetical protein
MVYRAKRARDNDNFINALVVLGHMAESVADPSEQKEMKESV